MGKVLAIDPGNEETGYVLADKDTRKPIEFGKIANRELADMMLNGTLGFDEFVSERMESMGTLIGRTVLEACEWVGRFSQIAEVVGCEVNYVYRHEEKIHICNDSRAKDSNIRRALIDRFAKTANGKGTSKNPDFFHGFKADVWSAYAVLTVYLDRKDFGGEHER